jgi:serine/threonine protein kinase
MSSAILGRTLGGRFRVVGFIGEGAMASVYRGVQEAEPHDVALKIMHPQLVSDPTFVGRFRREAKAAARIVHPNTVKILDTGVDGQLLYIAMELLAGQDLFETLVLERRLSRRGRCASSRRSPTRWWRPTRRASSTAISSPRTSCSCATRTTPRART